jgi:malonate transporter and related proteins
MTATLITVLLPVFFVIGLGYAAGRLGLLDNRQVSDLNAFVMQFAVPLSLLTGLATLPRQELIAEAPLAGLCLLVMTSSFAGWFLFVSRLGVDRSEAAVQALTVTFPNLAAVALPILSGFSGQKGVAEVAVALGVGAAVPTAATVVVIGLAKDGRKDGGAPRVAGAIGRALLKPLVVAPIVGTLLSLGGVTLPAAVLASFHLIGEASAGGALFLTGLVVSAQSIEIGRFAIGAVVFINLMRPPVMWLLAREVGASAHIIQAATLIAAVPAGFFGILFGVSNDVPVKITGSIIALSTVVAVVTLPVALFLLYPR